MDDVSSEVTLTCLDQVPGREATSASQSDDLRMVVLSGENADDKIEAETSAAEEILSTKQVPEKIQSPNDVCTEAETSGPLTIESANMPCQTGISMDHVSSEETLTCLDQVPGREATSASQSDDLRMVVLSGENADDKIEAETSAAEEILSTKQVPEKIQSPNDVCTEAETSGPLTIESANMPCQTGISMDHVSSEETLTCLDQVPGREATSASQSDDLRMVVLSGENADDKIEAETSAAEEILSTKQVPEKIQSPNDVCTEAETSGPLTIESANMPCQTGISMDHVSSEETLTCLDQVPGREATSASQSDDLRMVVLSGENADDKIEAETSAAEEILSTKQVPEKIQSTKDVCSEAETSGPLTIESANMPCQTGISMDDVSSEVTLTCLDQVPGREATSASQSDDLRMVVLSGENADDKIEAETSAAEEILSTKQVPEKKAETSGPLTIESANMPCQTGISMDDVSSEVTLTCLDQVPGREATSASQSDDLRMVVLSGENADDKIEAETSAAEEILSTKQVPEKIQSTKDVCSEAETSGPLTIESANMPCQTGISMDDVSSEVTLTCLDQVPGREATSASQSDDLRMVVLSGENADDKIEAETSAAEEILSTKQVPEKKAETSGPLTIESANMPCQTGISMDDVSSEVTLTCLDQVPGREATSASQSDDLRMVVLSGENADDKIEAETSAAEEILSTKQVPEKKAETSGPLTIESANMPCQTGISMAHVSNEVTLTYLDPVPGREATSASQSDDLRMVVLSGENADNEIEGEASAAKEILSTKQVPEKNIDGGKEWTSYNTNCYASDEKNRVDCWKYYLDFSQDHPCFSNGITVLAIQFSTEPSQPRLYIAQNDDRYRYESLRLATFSQYQGSGFRTRLAQSGYVYDVSRIMVMCPWDGSDVSAFTRNQHTLSCAFMMHFHKINIPLHEAPCPPLPASFGFNMAATMTFSPATEDQTDMIQSHTETESVAVASIEEPTKNAVSGLGQSSEGVNEADIGPIGSTEQEGYLLLFNADLDGMISQENDIDTNCSVHQAENSNADAISGADEGESTGDAQNDMEELLRENRRLRYAVLCESCKINPKCAVFVPCFHRLFCSECATSFRKCPACQQWIRNLMSADLS
ncbi:hypothetical protein ACJMK2_029196 [Sinanodonta woodiana]|uniref:RING-type domain-containing protein n=1 Tax=Sinanodonta woodiana TaxID=1069815 RepID=A0ABD3X9E9_SINWO